RAAALKVLLHFVQQVAELVLLRLQIAPVGIVGRDLDRYTLLDAESVAVKADDLLGIVGQQANVADAQVNEDLRADAVVTKVWREAELLIGFDRVQPLFLKLIGLQLGEQADAAPFLPHVEDDALAGPL